MLQQLKYAFTSMKKKHKHSSQSTAKFLSEYLLYTFCAQLQLNPLCRLLFLARSVLCCEHWTVIKCKWIIFTWLKRNQVAQSIARRLGKRQMLAENCKKKKINENIWGNVKDEETGTRMNRELFSLILLKKTNHIYYEQFSAVSVSYSCNCLTFFWETLFVK